MRRCPKPSSASVTACWDIGLEVGSSVRTVAECLAESSRDVTVQTALLEARLVCGARRLFTDFRKAHDAALDPRAYLRAKRLEMEQRHVKYEGTPYALEPNCKESPGGLRDLQVVIWVARAAGLGRTWSELAARGLITPFEASQLRKHEGTLMLIRARLHLVARRREDRLVFDLQTAVAESFGYRGTTSTSNGLRSSEMLMHRYYWAAKAVTQLNQILMLNIEERVNGSEAAPMRPITARFFDRAGMLEVSRDDLYLDNPHAILETFLVYQQTPGLQGLSARTLRALYNARQVMTPAYRLDPINRELFMDILRQPKQITHALRLMNQTSVLGRYLWAFRRIVGRMQHDLFHVYTVDQHILMVVRNVRRFFIPEHAHEYPFCSQLAAQWDQPWLLYVAALFHDIAKGRGGDHSELGAREVRRFCRDHGIARDDTQLIEFLVLHHLTMSRIAQKEDLSDAERHHRFRAPGRIAQAADGAVPADGGRHPRHQPQGVERVEGQAAGGPVPPDAARAGRRAAQRGRRDRGAQGGGAPQPGPSFGAARHRGAAVEHAGGQLLRAPRRGRDRLACAIAVAPCADRGADRARAAVVDRRRPAGAGLRTRPAPICSPASAATSTAAGFSIQDAKIHTTRAGFALDTFQVVASQMAPETAAGYRDLISLVETQAAQALSSEGPLPEPRSGRVSRRVRSFPGHAAHLAGAGRARAALAAHRLGQRPPGPALRDRPRAGAEPHQPAAGQGHDARRTGRGHLPRRRPRTATAQGATAHRKRAARRGGRAAGLKAMRRYRAPGVRIRTGGPAPRPR